MWSGNTSTVMHWGTLWKRVVQSQDLIGPQKQGSCFIEPNELSPWGRVWLRFRRSLGEIRIPAILTEVQRTLLADTQSRLMSRNKLSSARRQPRFINHYDSNSLPISASFFSTSFHYHLPNSCLKYLIQKPSYQNVIRICVSSSVLFVSLLTEAFILITEYSNINHELGHQALNYS